MLHGWRDGKGPQVELAQEEVAPSGDRRGLAGTRFGLRRPNLTVCAGIREAAVDQLVGCYDLPLDD